MRLLGEAEVKAWKTGALTMALALGSPLASQAEGSGGGTSANAPLRSHHHRSSERHGPRQAIAPVGDSRTAGPSDSKGDDHGLSTDVDDCNKGCIGGNPN